MKKLLFIRLLGALILINNSACKRKYPDPGSIYVNLVNNFQQILENNKSGETSTKEQARILAQACLETLGTEEAPERPNISVPEKTDKDQMDITPPPPFEKESAPPEKPQKQNTYNNKEPELKQPAEKTNQE